MKLWKSRFKPTRDALLGDPEVITDLDALVNEEVAFKLAGKTYKLRPLSAGEAFVVWQNLAKLESLKSQKEVSFQQIIEFYADLFGSICPEIKKKQVEDMSQTQCAALLQLVLDTVTGRVFVDAKKKALNQNP